MKYVDRIKPAHDRITNVSAAAGEICPAGISRIFVLGFFSSKERSINRLKAIAALRAVTMHASIRRNVLRLKGCELFSSPRKNPIKANGNAKTVWLNFTSEKYFATAFNYLA